VASSNGRPASCSEIGKPLPVNPHGSASAGSPLRLKGGVLLRGKPAWRSLDLMLLALGFGFVLHIFFDYDYFINRIIYIDDLTWSDKFFAVAAVGIVLEATRRVLGLALPITAIAFLIYAIGFTRVAPDVVMEQLYLSTEGIFGSTLGVSASYVMLFVLFGSFISVK